MTDQRPHPYNGRLTTGPDAPLPPLSPPEAPKPNDEDRRVAAETGRTPEYVAELRVVRTLPEWEAARAAEAERTKPKP